MRPVRKKPTARAIATLVAFAAVLAPVVGVLSSDTASALGHVGAQVTSTTTPPGLILTMSFEIPASATDKGLPTGAFVKSTLTITNPAPVSLTNQPMVLRFGQKPDQILSVDDGSGKVGVIDAATGAWYHTIATIGANSSTVYTITYAKVCPGKWAFAGRVGDKLTSQFVQFAGQSDGRCVGDETTNPQPASFYQLPWPTSISVPTTTSGTTTTVPTAGCQPTTTTTKVAGTSATGGTTTRVGVVGSNTTTATTSGISTTSTTTIASGAGPAPTSTTTTSVCNPSVTTTILSLDGRTPASTTTSTKVPTTTRTATTKAGSTGRTTTTVLFCKTVGGTRYCGPKSSAYKPGQKKSVEVKPKSKTKKK